MLIWGRGQKVKVFYSDDPDGDTYKKVSFIETGNPNHSVLKIRIEDNLDKAVSILNKSGFKVKEKNYYENGNIYIYLTPENNMVIKMRIGYIDRKLSGRVY
ncbi:MAG TPA: hypothetical protein GXX49_01780 [Clostridiaceae bacterium]|nr:hypothetical protein [Clostridiaceae bacterium]